MKRRPIPTAPLRPRFRRRRSAAFPACPSPRSPPLPRRRHRPAVLPRRRRYRASVPPHPPPAPPRLRCRRRIRIGGQGRALSGRGRVLRRGNAPGSGLFRKSKNRGRRCDDDALARVNHLAGLRPRRHAHDPWRLRRGQIEHRHEIPACIGPGGGDDGTVDRQRDLRTGLGGARHQSRAVGLYAHHIENRLDRRRDGGALLGLRCRRLLGLDRCFGGSGRAARGFLKGLCDLQRIGLRQLAPTGLIEDVSGRHHHQRTDGARGHSKLALQRGSASSRSHGRCLRPV
jgi:hypothetical protein